MICMRDLDRIGILEDGQGEIGAAALLLSELSLICSS
jgi:hypothetical protein